MAVHALSPLPRGRCAPALQAPALQAPALQAPALQARGLAVWVTLDDGQEIDDAVLARAAELVLARALRIAPEAEVHWPAAGAATSAAPSSSPSEDSPQADDDGATHLPPSAGPVSRVAVDLAQGEVLLDGRRVPLTGVEFKLLRYLVEHCSRAIDREELRLFLESFDSPGAAARSIDVYVGRVRRKLRGGRHAIATVRGGGYRFIPSPSATVRGPAEYSI
jgi:DNA-binding winged helix-turn-helix (wHTH) protein